jgi:hypothetical protein
MNDSDYNVDRKIDNILHDTDAAIDDFQKTITLLRERAKMKAEQNGQVKRDE